VDPTLETGAPDGEGGGGVLAELAGSIPGIDEAMTFAEVMRQVQTMDYDCIVFDTAPTGHTLRLLQLPTTLEQGLAKLMSVRGALGGALAPPRPAPAAAAPPPPPRRPGLTRPGPAGRRSARCWASTWTPRRASCLASWRSSRRGGPAMLSRPAPAPPPPALRGRARGPSAQRVVEEVNAQFRDPELTTFVCVCIPEFLSLYETERLVQELARFEIDASAIVINQARAAPAAASQPPACRCCLRPAEGRPTMAAPAPPSEPALRFARRR